MLSILDSDENLNILTQKFIKKLDGCIEMNFKKVRLNTSTKHEDKKTK